MKRKMMTNQQIFDTVVNHLQVQGKKAYSKAELQCKYRTKEGLSCAVGCLIPDALYDAEIEGATIRGLSLPLPNPDKTYVERAVKFANILAKAGLSRRSYPLLEALQSAHDGAEDDDWTETMSSSSSLPEALTKRLQGIAAKFNLKTPF